MRKSATARPRVYSCLVSAFIDGMLGLVQTSVPLLAIRMGADAWFLGILGGVPQAIRVPCCLLSGTLSDKFGRTRIMYLAGVLLIFGTVGAGLSQNRTQVFIAYSCLLVGVGAFYPSFLSFLGERSGKGELRGNLSSFNMGWTIAGSLCAIVAGFLFAAGKGIPFWTGSFFVLGAMTVVFLWSRTRADECDDPIPSTAVQSSDRLLVIARVGHAVGFFGFGIVRNIFPKLGMELGITEGTIGVLVGLLLAGQAVGMFIAGSGLWWCGKLWPLLLSQITMCAAALVIHFTASSLVFGMAIMLFGLSLAITYTSTQYYGLMQKDSMGRNSGISESLIAGGIVLGCIAGGWIAQRVSLRAPYMFMSILSACSALFSIAYWLQTERSAIRESATARLFSRRSRVEQAEND